MWGIIDGKEQYIEAARIYADYPASFQYWSDDGLTILSALKVQRPTVEQYLQATTPSIKYPAIVIAAAALVGYMLLK